MFTRIQLLALSLVTAIAAFLTAFYQHAPNMDEQTERAVLALDGTGGQTDKLQEQLSGAAAVYDGLAGAADESLGRLGDIRGILAVLIDAAERERQEAAVQKQAVDAIISVSAQHAKETSDVLDTVLSKILGDPIGQTFGKRATVKVFSLKEAGYRGYMAKVKLHDPTAVRLVMAGDTVGHKGETTSAAAKRTGAVLAVNGGGFARGDNGLLYPMGITVVDGEIVTFYRTDLSFIGFNKSGNLVGGEITTREQIQELEIMHGATFVPTLLKDGKKVPIPQRYAGKREPRTMIGHFSNGDLLFIVIDGRQKGSSGVTLEEAQDKLLEFNVRDAYNLDGGGSSTFVYNNKVLNNPSDGQERRVVSNIVIMP